MFDDKIINDPSISFSKWIDPPEIKSDVNHRETKHKKKQKKQKKKSIGIAICRINQGVPEMLMVQNRVTYSYNEFILNKYTSENILSLFDGMTVNEKCLLLSLDFEKIWYHTWLNNYVSGKSDLYSKMKQKFEKFVKIKFRS